jgi:hypothetical protein
MGIEGPLDKLVWSHINTQRLFPVLFSTAWNDAPNVLSSYWPMPEYVTLHPLNLGLWCTLFREFPSM